MPNDLFYLYKTRVVNNYCYGTYSTILRKQLRQNEHVTEIHVYLDRWHKHRLETLIIDTLFMSNEGNRRINFLAIFWKQ